MIYVQLMTINVENGIAALTQCVYEWGYQACKSMTARWGRIGIDDSSPILLFVLSLVILQVTANLRGEIYTLQSRDDGLTKRARKADYQAHPAGELVCRPFGLCEPCPVDEVSTFSLSHVVHPVVRSSSMMYTSRRLRGEVFQWFLPRIYAQLPRKGWMFPGS